MSDSHTTAAPQYHAPPAVIVGAATAPRPANGALRSRVAARRVGRRRRAARLAAVISQLRRLSAAHQRLRDGVRREAADLIDQGRVCRRGTNDALSRLGLPPLEEPQAAFAMVFAVPVSLFVCAPKSGQARAGARRLILDDQVNLRDAERDDNPRIDLHGPDGTDRYGRTRFQARADLELIVYADGVDGEPPWAQARQRLLTDLAHLRHVRPRLDELRDVVADRIDPLDSDRGTATHPDDHAHDADDLYDEHHGYGRCGDDRW